MNRFQDVLELGLDTGDGGLLDYVRKLLQELGAVHGLLLGFCHLRKDLLKQ